MRFDVLIKHRNFDSVARMLHKKATPDKTSRVAFKHIFREVDFSLPFIYINTYSNSL